MKHKTLIILLIITLTLSIYLTSAKYIIFNQRFYEKEFDKNKVSVENAPKISKGLLNFFKGNNKIPNVFTKKEASHLIDVRNLIKKVDNLLTVLSLINIILLSFLLFNKEKLSRPLISAGILIIVMPIPFLFLKFSDLFLKFHILFFPQGNWQFSINSVLIRLFPQQFFYHALIKIIIISCIISVFLLLIGFISSKISSN